VVFSPQPLYSALSLVLAIGALAVVFLVLNAQFLFVVQLIVYAGAVMVLFVFIIALLSPGAEERVRIDSCFVIGAVEQDVEQGNVNYVTRREGDSMKVDAVPLAPMPDNLVQLLTRSRFYDLAKLPKGYLRPEAMPAAAAKESA
jgi:NADH-ubiquinone/plastoquinone oxidoreductase chain 6